MPVARSTRGASTVRGGLVVAVAMGVMNVGTYGFTILAARLLGPVNYGALAAVMGLLLIVNVVSLGLQATAARRVAANPEQTSGIEAEILSISYRAALGLGALCLAATPLVSSTLRLDSWLTAALLAVTVIPLTVMGGQAGVLQGERRWTALALVYLSVGVGRLASGGIALWWHQDELSAMLGVAVGAFLPVLVGWVALRNPARAPQQSPGRLPKQRPPGGRLATGLLKEVGHSSHALLAFFALSNVDVLIARSVLDAHDAGLYAGGLILTKAVLFLPQFVVVIAFPSMSTRGGHRAHLRGLGVVFAIGAATVLGAAALSSLAVVFIGGREYVEIQSDLWAFAALGTLLAMLQLMVYSVLARQRRRSVLLVWAGLAIVLACASFVNTVAGLLTVVASVDLALLVVLVLRNLRSRPEAAEATAVATSVA